MPGPGNRKETGPILLKPRSEYLSNTWERGEQNANDLEININRRADYLNREAAEVLTWLK